MREQLNTLCTGERKPLVWEALKEGGTQHTELEKFHCSTKSQATIHYLSSSLTVKQVKRYSLNESMGLVLR